MECTHENCMYQLECVTIITMLGSCPFKFFYTQIYAAFFPLRFSPPSRNGFIFRPNVIFNPIDSAPWSVNRVPSTHSFSNYKWAIRFVYILLQSGELEFSEDARHGTAQTRNAPLSVCDIICMEKSRLTRQETVARWMCSFAIISVLHRSIGQSSVGLSLRCTSPATEHAAFLFDSFGCSSTNEMLCNNNITCLWQ